MIPNYGSKNDGSQDDFAMIVETDDVPDSSFGEGDSFDLSVLAQGKDDDMIAMLGKPGNYIRLEVTNMVLWFTFSSF